MATNTSRLGLLKKDTATDGNDTFNIKTMLNDNWDKIDAKVATLGADGKVPADQLSISVGDASTTQKGVVQLEDGVASTSTTKAATPKSVKTVNDALASHKTDLASQATGKGASLIGINDSANQFTATTVEGALSELFTSVSNGKTQVANAITAKGQTASGNDTFAQLAAAITAINTGKKWATGESTSSSSQGTAFQYTGSTSPTISFSVISVTGIGFKPSFIIASVSGGGTTVYLSNGYAYGKTINVVNGNNTSPGNGYNLKGDAAGAIITDSQFTIPICYPDKLCRWIAFE